jgi:hypothetical protein
VYLSSHGYGHFVRTSTFLERLVARIDCDLDVTASYPRALWPQSLAAHTRAWRQAACDAGVVQASELVVDRDATARVLEQFEQSYARLLDQEASRLAGRATAVLADVPPLGIAAAHAAGVPGFALANFSWDWIYARMGFAESAALAAQAYRCAHTLLALEPAAQMPAFERSVSLGTLGRASAHERHGLRKRLGVGVEERLVLVAFREAGLCKLPPPSFGIRYVRTDRGDADRSDVLAAPRDLEFVDVVKAADVVVAKAGYGIIGDTAACGTSLLYTQRSGFPEDEVLGRWLDGRAGNARVETPGLAAGTWLDELESLLTGPRPAPVSQEGVAVGVELLAGVLGG